MASGLHVGTLSLSHFRSHRRASIDCHGRPVALIGPNGAGKTNILEAVSLLSPGRGLRRAPVDDLIRQPEAIGWKVRAEIGTDDATHEIETWSDAGSPRQVRLNGKTVSQIALGNHVRLVWLVPSMDRLWTDGAAERRRFLDRAALSLDPGHAQVSLDYEKAMRERNRLLKDGVQDTAWFDALEARMAEAGARITATRRTTIIRLQAAQENATTDFPLATLGLTDPDDEAPQSDPDALRGQYSSGRARDMAAGRTLSGPHRSDLHVVFANKDVPAKLCSTGEQKALLVSLVLANARALSQDFGAPPILLLDEIAAHLDEKRRRSLFDEIGTIGAQSWMTGTESELFEGLEADAIRCHVSEIAGESVVELM